MTPNEQRLQTWMQEVKDCEAAAHLALFKRDMAKGAAHRSCSDRGDLVQSQLPKGYSLTPLGWEQNYGNWSFQWALRGPGVYDIMNGDATELSEEQLSYDNMVFEVERLASSLLLPFDRVLLADRDEDDVSTEEGPTLKEWLP